MCTHSTIGMQWDASHQVLRNSPVIFPKIPPLGSSALTSSASIGETSL